MAGDALGVMNIVLSANAATFSEGIAQAQRKLDELSRSSTRAGHATVSSTQAASAALRVMNGDMTNNIRAVERFVGMIPGVGNALKLAFPLVGGIAFAGLLADLSGKVQKFIKDTEELPARIRTGFDEMHSSAQLANDELRLTDDRLQNEINKLSGKPQNNLAISLDEARIAADKLSASLAEDSRRVKSLLDENQNGMMAQLLMGKGSTADVTGSVESYQNQIRKVSFDMNDAVHRGDAAAASATRKQLDQMTMSYDKWLDTQIRLRTSMLPGRIESTGRGVVRIAPRSYASEFGNQDANLSILQGARSLEYDRRDQQVEETRNSLLVPQKEKLMAERAGAAAEKAARDKAAKEQMESFEQQLAVMQRNHQLQIGEEEMFWRRMQGQTKTGSENWLAINKKIGTEHQNTMRQFAAQAKELAIGQAQVDEVIGRISSMQSRGRQTDVSAAASGMVDSNQLAIVNAHNDARKREAEIMDAAGRSMTNYAAAIELAKVHSQEFANVSQALEGILHDRQMVAGLNPSKENARAVAEAQAAIIEAGGQRQAQQQSDYDAINGRSSSAAVGFVDAIDEFTLAMRDGARQVSELFRDALGSFNNQILNGVTGQRTDFKGATIGNLRNVAGLGLEHAEGSIMGLLGLGSKKKPTGAPGDAIHTIVDNPGGIGAPGSGVASLAKGVASKTAMGGFGHIVGSLLSSFLPGFASGGAISPGTWAVVGEQGPELFHSGGGGSIIPNHKIAAAGAGGGSTFSYTIDARGTDPVQTEMRVRSAIVAAHQSSVHQAVKQVHQQSVRQPARSR